MLLLVISLMCQNIVIYLEKLIILFSLSIAMLILKINQYLEVDDGVLEEGVPFLLRTYGDLLFI